MKKTLSLLLSGVLSVSLLAGCGGGTASQPSAQPSASGGAEAEASASLEGTTNAVEDGSLDANYFQHITYLNNFNVEYGTSLVSAAEVHYEPFGIYAGKTASLDALQDGAQIAVPNDTTNEGRALLLLQDQGLITLSEDCGLEATKDDIVDNPHNYEIVELEAKLLPTTLQDVDIAVINGNYAIDAGLSVSDALAIEAADSAAAEAYVNVLAVKEGRETDPAIQALSAALCSDEVKAYIDETYGGAVVAVF